MADRFDLILRGARGTLPLCADTASRYGGNTSCIEVRHGGRVAVLDAGSGIVALGKALVAEGVDDIDLLLTHAHYDHVIGLPLFAPLHCKGCRVTLWYAGDSVAPDGQSLLAELIRPPFLPFGPRDLQADLRFGVLPKAGSIALAGGTTVTTAPVNHPGGAVALRVARGGAAAVFAPDFEPDDGPMDAALVALMQGCDTALLDCTYFPEEFAAYRGWGHSHWRHSTTLAAAAGVARPGLFHHNFTATDAQIATTEALARQIAPKAFAAAEGMVLTPRPR